MPGYKYANLSQASNNTIYYSHLKGQNFQINPFLFITVPPALTSLSKKILKLIMPRFPYNLPASCGDIGFTKTSIKYWTRTHAAKCLWVLLQATYSGIWGQILKRNSDKSLKNFSSLLKTVTSTNGVFGGGGAAPRRAGRGGGGGWGVVWEVE